MHTYRLRLSTLSVILLSLAIPATAQTRHDREQADEDLIHTPPGFSEPGKPALATGEDAAALMLQFIDAATGKPTPCRVNVVGPDGQFYQPTKHRLAQYSLTGHWPATGKANRRGKAPVRYFGRFFYSPGETSVKVPPGKSRVEVWKGFEFRPQTVEVEMQPNEIRELVIPLKRTIAMHDLGYYSGDTHLHLERANEEDETDAFHLLQAEDVRYGGVLCYNPTASYRGEMSAQDFKQLRGLGVSSIKQRGDYQIISGQEYRSIHYGHTKVFLADDLVQAGRIYDPISWPTFGEAVRDIRDDGGLVFWAHGGYEKEIWADFIHGGSDGVELLQFGIYRPIGLEGWYRILNIGFNYPAMGASDYPPCRKFADCRTYVHADKAPRIDDWLRLLAKGQSFFTTGPLLLLEVDGVKPGGSIRRKAYSIDTAPSFETKVKVFSEVAPITDIELIVNGRVVERKIIPQSQSRGRWLELNATLNLPESSWIAARAYSKAPTGSPDGEAHTNPVHVYINEKAPYNAADLDWLLEKLDSQILFHTKREFPRNAGIGAKAKAIGYFKAARKKLLAIRDAGGKKAPTR